MPSLPQELVAGKAALLNEKGREALSTGQFSQAVSVLTQAIYLTPDVPELYGLRAEAHLRLCDLHSAIANLRKAYKLSL